MKKSLVQLRKDRDWSQRDLAARAGVSQPTICDIENGYKSPRLDTANKIAAALAVELGEIEFPAVTRSVAS